MLIHTIIIAFLILSVNSEEQDLAAKIKAGLTEYIKTGVISPNLTNDVKSLRSITDFKLNQEQSCLTCKYVVDGVLQYRKSGVDKNALGKLLEDLCVIFGTEKRHWCVKRVGIQIDELLYMIDNGKKVTSDRVCAMYLGTDRCPDPGYKQWHINIPEESNMIISDEQSQGEVLKVLHLTDIHFDPQYTPGSDVVCDEPICCRGGTPAKPENAAGYWGDYHACDMPWHSVLDLMDQVVRQHQFNYVYYTGDIMHHSAWLLSKELNLNDIGRLFDLFSERFKDTPVYPVLGNHEAHPVNYYSPDNVSTNVSTQWLFDFVAEKWSKWLPEDTNETIRRGGYYTVLARKGFRIIALNSNVCYFDNIWLFYDDVDQYGQLQWLADTLKQAESNGEVVHILSHIPPGSRECWYPWVTEFNRIIRRFAKTVKAQFNGHTHEDEIRVFLNENKTEVINVAYNGGSFTTFIGMNPNYRVYDMDSGSFDILDYDEWIYNITEANRSNSTAPDWFKLYSFKDAYGLNSTSNADLYDWLKRMQDDPNKTLLKRYHKYLSRDSDVKGKGCSDRCLSRLLCYIQAVEFQDTLKC